MKHLISLKEQNKSDLLEIINCARRVKDKWAKGENIRILEGKTLLMLFQKNSTRTRLSFEAAMTQLGGHAIYIDARSTQMSLADFNDEIRAMMSFGDVLMYRSRKSADVEAAASFNQIPVIDACSEKYHPCQALGDILTMTEAAGEIDKIGKVVWLGIENNVSNTLKLACAKLGIKITLVTPENDPDSKDILLDKQAEESGMVLRILDLEGLAGASFVHTDTWVNMEYFDNGKIKSEFEQEFSRRKERLAPYQLNGALMEKYCPEAKIMHCMPCHVGYEISRDAIDHKNSLIFRQAENRMHVQKAILLWLLEKHRQI